ncbi:PaaI family thioesterase [Candidatus Cryosericum hinesii]|jgi:acyl-coenzyme A thioesterase PaaI-like protein|uniref:PaaI family thioesterase n=1 Tax=Candidatus Cryosericum hinesii TaxID=2290915 RepID=A0A398DDV1_9BACT|nr:PaaI family thioesterase [Candidatus Cryosericum hinesii]RIE08638.1 PaaI family thioesterase [Candidatus Cryosericum hinesii]RIE12467.1 PaaI family thioesterase [Candidatus Cryosericum hinesii]RIE12663.1 PaaI family thioesterase [Candidatus Cryosericum hinesii]
MKARIDNCFVCSSDNPAGLHLRFDVGNGTSTAEFLLDSTFDGYRGVTHGGIQAAILDDAMANIFFGTGLPAFTVDIHVRYHRPMYSNRKYRVEARLAEDRGSRIKATEACIKDLATGEVVTEATATFLIGRSLLESVRSKNTDEHQQQESHTETESDAGAAEEVSGPQAHSAEHADSSHHAGSDSHPVAVAGIRLPQEASGSAGGGQQVRCAGDKHGHDQA